MGTKGPPDPDYILRGDGQAITALKFHTNEQRNILLSGKQNGNISIWELKQRRVVDDWKAHPEQSVLAMKVLADGTLFTHGRDGYVHLWAADDTGWLKKANKSIPTHSAGFCPATTVHLNNSEHLVVPSVTNSSGVDIISHNSKGFQKVLSLIPEKSLEVYKCHGMCMMISVSNDTSILIGYEDGSLILWDIRNAPKYQNTVKVCSDSIMAFAYNKKINKGFCGSVNNIIKIFTIDTDNGALKILQEHISLTNHGINCLAVRPDGKLFVSGGWDSQVRLFSCKKYNPLAVLSFHRESVQSVDFAEDNTLSAGSRDGVITMWNLYK